MPWDTETTEKLKKLWAEGHTASQISKMLGGGISRNAVIGKAHRLSLGGRTQSRMISSPRINNFNNQNKIQGQKRIRRPRGLRAIVIEKDFEAEKPTTLENLTDKTCRWPIGHPNEENFYFCGRTPEADFSYCRLHIFMAFQPKNQKEELIDKEDDVPAFIEKKVKASK